MGTSFSCYASIKSLASLRDEEIGASIQHYNPVIDEWVKEVYDLPEHWELVAQMPFGKIEEEPEAKDKKPIEEKLLVIE